MQLTIAYNVQNLNVYCQYDNVEEMKSYRSPSLIKKFIQSDSIKSIGEWGGPITPVQPMVGGHLIVKFEMESRCYCIHDFNVIVISMHSS